MNRRFLKSRTPTWRWTPFAAVTSAVLAAAPAGPAAGQVSFADLDRLLRAVRPQPGESPWREIDWLTDVTEARSRSVAEDKPVLVFTAADGSPLGRT
jgi:hypothetical protein